jgi:hypothetical protein
VVDPIGSTKLDRYAYVDYYMIDDGAPTIFMWHGMCLIPVMILWMKNRIP